MSTVENFAASPEARQDDPTKGAGGGPGRRGKVPAREAHGGTRYPMNAGEPRWRRLREHFLRFLIVGAVNTLLSYLVYLLLQFVLEYNIAYSV